MNERRLELGMKWDEVAQAAGIKPPTLRAIRNGTNGPSELSQRGIERAMQWEVGSVRAVLAGGDPVPIESPMDR
ncbi:helix-turn-helix domain-containing protein, partial [Actinomadura adrarensis]